MCLIECKNITLSYISKDEQQYVFKDMNLSISSFGLVSIVGESGCGKSTLLNLIAGYNKEYKGEIKTFCSCNQISFVFQNLQLIDHLSALENIALPLIVNGQKRKNALKKAEEQMDKLSLLEFKNRKIDELSGGQRARVALCRALVTESKIILADEPTGSLDSYTSREIMDELKKISKDHLVMIVTHNEDLAEEYSDVIYTVENYNMKKIKEVKYHTNVVEEKEKKLGSIRFTENILLSLSFLKNKIRRISFALLFTSMCFAIVLMIFSALTTGKNEILNLGRNYYNYSLVELSYNKKYEVENSNISLSKKVKLEQKDINTLNNSLTNKIDCFPSLDFLIEPYMNYYSLGLLSKNKISFYPSRGDKNKISNGRISNSYNEVVVNKTLLVNEKKKIGDEICIKYTKKINTTYLSTFTDDLIEINIPFRIVGVSIETELLNRPSVYYDYDKIYDFFINTKLINASDKFNTSITLKERLGYLSSSDDFLSSYKSLAVCDDPLEIKKIIDAKYKDIYQYSSVALSMTYSMMDLISSFSQVVLLFVVLALVCSFLLEFVLIENIYYEKKRELALYLSFHISEKNFYKIGMGQVVLIGLFTIIYSIVLYLLLSIIGNKILVNFSLPKLFSSYIEIGMVGLISVLAYVFSYFCGQIPLRSIYRSNLIDSLKGE